MLRNITILIDTTDEEPSSRNIKNKKIPGTVTFRWFFIWLIKAYL